MNEPRIIAAHPPGTTDLDSLRHSGQSESRVLGQFAPSHGCVSYHYLLGEGRGVNDTHPCTKHTEMYNRGNVAVPLRFSDVVHH